MPAASATSWVGTVLQGVPREQMRGRLDDLRWALVGRHPPANAAAGHFGLRYGAELNCKAFKSAARLALLVTILT
jgi:hypothetical protein